MLSAPPLRRPWRTVVPLHPCPVPRTLVVVPCLDEGPRVASLVRALRALPQALDVLVVDDGSRDDTATQAKAAGATVVRHPFNLGYGAALQSGYAYARERGYERLVQMDGDGQHPPSEVPALLARLDRGDVDLVVGSRFLGEARYRIPPVRRLGIALFSALTSQLMGQRITDPTSGLQAMSREVFAFYEQDFYPYDYPDADILLRAHYAGLRLAETPVCMLGGPPDRSMHRGLRPLYYVYKLLLSLLVVWLGRRTSRP